MSEQRRPDPHTPQEGFDKEIDTRSIGLFGLWLTIGVLVAVIAMWLLYRDFTRKEEALDQPGSPLVDRTQRRLPPEPRLQTTPEIDLEAYLAEERRRVASYGWIDEKQGIVHLPVDRSMDLLLEKGFPARPVPAAADEAPTRSAAEEPRVRGGAHP